MPKGRKIGDLIGRLEEMLEQYTTGNTTQPGMFSTLDEVVKEAPFEKNSGDQWAKYLTPGRMLKREGSQFPLKKEELEWSNIQELLPRNPTLTKAEVLEMLSDNRQGFGVTMSREIPNEGGRFPGTPIPESWTAGGRQLGAEVKVDSPRYGSDFAGDTDSRLFHSSPGSLYEESVTRMPGLRNSNHFAADTLSWSRTSTHNMENPSYQPSSGQTRQYDKVRLVEEIQSDLHSEAADAFLLDPETGKYHRSMRDAQGALDEEGIERLVKVRRGHKTKESEAANDELNERLAKLFEEIETLDPVLQSGDMNVRYSRLNDEITKVSSELKFVQSKTQNAPYKNPSDYAGLELRKQLLNAVENDEQYLALVRGRDQVQRYSQGMDERAKAGMELMYDDVYRGELKKLAKRYGGTIEDIEVPVSQAKDVRPGSMVEYEMESVDEMADFVQLAIDESTQVRDVTDAVSDYIADMQDVQGRMEGNVGMIDVEADDNAIHSLVKRMHKVERTLADNFEGALADVDGAREAYSAAAEEFSKVHAKYKDLYEGYELFWAGGSSASNTKSFPAIKLTDELKETVKRLGVPQYQRGGLVRPDQGLKPGYEMILPQAQMATLNEEELEQLAVINERISGLSQEDKEHIAERMEDMELDERMNEPKYYLDALKHVASGFTRQWKTLNPETGEPEWRAPPITMQIRPGMSAEQREQIHSINEVIREQPFRPGIVDESIEFAEIPYAIADFFTEKDIPRPDWLTDAMERAQSMAEANREEWGVGPPRGWIQHGAEGLGMMAGQIPLPGKVIEKGIDIAGAPVRAIAGPLGRMMDKVPGKVPGPVRMAGKVGAFPFKMLSEAAVPVVSPKLQNYLMGAGFNAALGSALEPGEEEFRLMEMQKERQEEVERNTPEMVAFIEENWDSVDMEDKMTAIYDPDYGEVVWETLTGEQQMELMEALEDRGMYAEQE